ncbi:NF-kappa-B essential modulator [Oryzias melastigma]|uniref:NF-kappa-B essential modulator n=1 Tax=Oryzias melastigma TaxID=30732 RepID=A0A834F8Q4_ORYME|nr:NF-kappa-B essential modulator [Oryzias melastigma]
MVQPQPDGPMQWDMSGEDSAGALRVPPELAGHEVVSRLLCDNQQLREALRRSNQALRLRCEEMEGWQQRTRDEREFLSCRFQEARALVERLAQEKSLAKGHSERAGLLPFFRCVLQLKSDRRPAGASNCKRADGWSADS